MKVELVNITDNAIETIFKAYRICYSKLPYSDIKLKSEEEMIDFIKKYMVGGHSSPLEHVNVTFSIDGISRACLSQLTRHRTMSFNVKSQRYVNEAGFEFVVPKAIEEIPIANELFLQVMDDLQAAYEKFKAMGVKNEDARAILPNATTCNLLVTVDLNNFRKFLALRKCQHAQLEIRELANEMCRLVKDVIPFVDYKCMNCGKICNDCFTKGVA